MVRSIAGHGFRITRYPPDPAGTGLPSRVTTSTLIPGSGRVHEPGFVGVAPGMGLIIMAPVSVCPQVSTVGHRSCPITLRYHIHASGLIDSQTLASNRRLFIGCWAGH